MTMTEDSSFVGAGIMILAGIILSLLTTVMLDHMSNENSTEYYDEGGTRVSEEVWNYINR